jgi:trk system potassium uptake protein
MFWLMSLLLIRVCYPWIPEWDWRPLLLDGGILFSLYFLFKSNQIARAVEAWYFLRLRRHDRMKRQLNLALASDFLRLVSIPFGAMWLWRWTAGWPGVLAQQPTPRDFTFVDVFIFCLLLAFSLDTNRFRRLLTQAQMTSGRQILVHYSIAILAGTFLLLLPLSLQEGQSLSLINSLFITVSALSVTGLTPIDVATVLSLQGQVILLILIQLGGLGIVLLIAGFSAATFNRLSMNSILLGREMYGSCRVGEVPEFLTKVVSLTLITELLGAICLYFSIPSDTPNRIFVAVFHSISAFCNAGFSTFSANLHNSPFSFFGLTTFCILIMLGGLGFPIMLDLWSSYQRKEKAWRHLSPHARLTLIVMSVLLVTGPIMFFLLESLRPSAPIPVMTRIGQALFYSISSRTAGFNLIPVDQFHLSAVFWLIILMAIGANPSSTGGGMKTTTIGVLLTAVLRTIQGRNQTVFANRAIPTATIARALTVVTLYVMVAGFAVMILVVTESHSPFALAFEVISALSTVGLSMNVTGELSVFGKLIIIFLMLFGRIGILSFVLAGIGNVSGSKIKYPKDDFFVG